MNPARCDRSCFRGATYTHTLTFTDDLSDRTWTATAWPVGSPQSPVCTFTVDDTDAATGVLVLSLTAAQTSVLSGKFRWALVGTGTGVEAPVGGVFLVSDDAVTIGSTSDTTAVVYTPESTTVQLVTAGSGSAAANDLVSFIDFRGLPDGPMPARTNGPGTDDPGTVANISDYVPAYFSPTVVEDGAARPPVDGDPARAGFLIFADDGHAGRIHYQHAGYLNQVPLDLPDGQYISGNMAIADGSGNGYIIHTKVYSNGDESVHCELQLVRDDESTPVILERVTLDALPVDGDIISMGWDASGKLTGYLNGVAMLSVVDTTYDPTTFVGLSTIMWQDYPVYRHGVRWMAFTSSNRAFDPDREAPTVSAFSRLVDRVVTLED